MPHEVSAGSASEALQVPYSRVATFVRQVTHDVRNHLNAMDLQAAYASELVADPEAVAEVKRVRALIQVAARQLQVLSANFQGMSPSLVPYTAAILLEDLQARLLKNFPENAGAVAWKVDLGEEMVEVDVEMLFTALQELFRNAFQFGTPEQPIQANVTTDGEQVLLEILESKAAAPATSPDTWGIEPFVSSRRSGYGLGLFRVRRVLQIHGGDLEISYEEEYAQLRTRVRLPLARPS